MFLFYLIRVCFAEMEGKKMKERLKIILTGLGIIIFAVIGLWEYMQMFLYFDIPQIIVVMPVVGMLAAILILVIFMLVGVGGGFLVRVLVNKNKSRVVGSICCVLGILVTFGGSLVMFHNPLYPFLARHAIHNYAEKYDSERYKVSEVIVYFSYEELEYQGRVVMSDGVIYAVYHERETGKVYDLTDLS